ncbi:MAG: hypothetical protein B6D59_00750 [Campylobacteraceae bacterium 4484_4]|nr:MAG: hypothetical protein B6D59_00750 [Campylobacteraceae bacterium 4484_4]
MHSIIKRWNSLKFSLQIFESVILSLSFVSLLYLLGGDPNSATSQDMELLFLALVTLFSGTFSGIVALVTMSGGIYFMDFTFDERLFLKYLVFILLFGEFRYHWERRYRQNEEEKTYLKQKFRELSNAFFALKVSHDQLEKGYLLKPVTLRSLIIKLSSLSEKERTLETLFETFEEAFALKGALYCRLDSKGALTSQYAAGKSRWKYDPENPMLKEAMETKRAVFLAQSTLEQMEQEPILAVLPVLDSNEEIISLCIIEKMDFLSFSMDNILKLQILMEYYEQEILQHENLLQYGNKGTVGDMDAKFYFEIGRLSRMRQRYGIHSSIVILSTTDPAISLLMENFKTKKMRLLDMVDVIRKRKETYYLFLLPLERVSGAISFKKRLESELLSFDKKSYRIIVSEIEQIAQVEAWLAQGEKV